MFCADHHNNIIYHCDRTVLCYNMYLYNIIIIITRAHLGILGMRTTKRVVPAVRCY